MRFFATHLESSFVGRRDSIGILILIVALDEEIGPLFAKLFDSGALRLLSFRQAPQSRKTSLTFFSLAPSPLATRLVWVEDELIFS